jgi:hypothetical protein
MVPGQCMVLTLTPSCLGRGHPALVLSRHYYRFEGRRTRCDVRQEETVVCEPTSDQWRDGQGQLTVTRVRCARRNTRCASFHSAVAADQPSFGVTTCWREVWRGNSCTLCAANDATLQALQYGNVRLMIQNYALKSRGAGNDTWRAGGVPEHQRHPPSGSTILPTG